MQLLSLAIGRRRTAPAGTPAAGLHARLLTRLHAALHQQAANRAACHFARQPRALGVVFDGPSPCGLPPARWVEGVAGQGCCGWADQGLAHRRGQPPMCLLYLAVATPERAWAVCEEVAHRAPSGSQLLLAASDRALLQRLRDPAHLASHHRRLRLDRLHRPHAAAGSLCAAWGLAHELLHGQPPLALCELGIDP